MKLKHLSAFVLSALLAAAPIAAYGADITLDENTDFSGDCFQFQFEGQQKITDEQTLTLAAYNDQQQLVDLHTLSVAGWSKYNRFPVRLDDYLTDKNKATTLKAFLWDNTLNPFAACSVLGKSTVTNLEQPTVCTFYDNKPAALSITFDDGKYDAAKYYNSIFRQRGLCGTAFLIANSTLQNDVPKWRELLNEGYVDVGNHSASHAIKYDESSVTPEVLETDITKAYENLSEWFPDQNILTFASPWGRITEDSRAEMKKNHYANRIAGGNLQNANPQGDNWFSIRCFTYNGHTTAEMNGWIDNAIQNKGWAVELLHSYVPGDTPNGLNIAETIFDEHTKYIAEKKGQLWIATFNQVTAYIKERQSATVTIDWANETTMGLTVTDSLPDQQFHQPLTLTVNVPLDWKNGATYSQNGRGDYSQVVHTAPGKRYVQINAIPDGGRVILQKR